MLDWLHINITNEVLHVRPSVKKGYPYYHYMEYGTNIMPDMIKYKAFALVAIDFSHTVKAEVEGESPVYKARILARLSTAPDHDPKRDWQTLDQVMSKSLGLSVHEVFLYR